MHNKGDWVANGVSIASITTAAISSIWLVLSVFEKTTFGLDLNKTVALQQAITSIIIVCISSASFFVARNLKNIHKAIVSSDRILSIIDNLEKSLQDHYELEYVKFRTITAISESMVSINGCKYSPIQEIKDRAKTCISSKKKMDKDILLKSKNNQDFKIKEIQSSWHFRHTLVELKATIIEYKESRKESI